MRIALNAHLLSFAATYRGAGISRSIANLLRGLQVVDAENEYTVFLGTRHVPPGVLTAPNFRPALSPLPTAWPPARILWEQLVQPIELARRHSDLLHALAYVLPLAWPGPSVVTVYDLSFWHTPERFPAAQRLYLATLTRLSVRRAARVIAISQSTKRDLVELLSVPADRVRVVPLAIEDEFRPVTETTVLADLRRRRGLPEHMLLYVGTLEPRKNLITLLEAYARCRGEASPESPWPPLVLAGGKGWGYEAIFAAVERLGLGAAVLFWVGGFALPAGVQVGLASAVLVAGCMVCHGELASSAPAVLTDFFELPASLLATFALMVVAMGRDPESVLAGRGRRFALAALGSLWLAAALAFASPGLRNAEGTVEAARNFYGVLRVQDRPEGVFREMRVLRHGRIFHGAEYLDAERRAMPTAYFVEGSGVERALAARRARSAGEPLRIGVIGLGVGTLAAWTEAGDTMRFYEINPDAERLARARFTFLAAAAGAVDVVLGDGRLALEREVEAGSAAYDVLVVDAFAGDAVPVHLLTLESVALYRRALAEGGVLVFQITNRHVDLERVVRGLAGAAGLQAVRIDHAPAADGAGVASSWMVLAEPGTWIPAERRSPGSRPAGPPVLWTDDFSNVLSVLGGPRRR